jgi:hypothetical protein
MWAPIITPAMQAEAARKAQAQRAAKAHNDACYRAMAARVEGMKVPQAPKNWSPHLMTHVDIWRATPWLGMDFFPGLLPPAISAEATSAFTTSPQLIVAIKELLSEQRQQCFQCYGPKRKA